MIQISQLNKSYFESEKEIKIFENLDVDFSLGSRNILLGSSGSGKSTFLNLVSALDEPDSGSINIDGVDITNLSQTDKTKFRRAKIGFIFQFFNLIPTLNVQDNIFLPLELNGTLDKQNESYALELLDRVGLLDRQQAMPDKLSGGEQQRVAIVRALAHKPQLIVADEATGNLDLATASKIIDLLDDLLQETNATLVMATHDQALVRIADSVYELKDHNLRLK